MDLQFKIKKSITEKELISVGDHVLIGVSGGIDSMVLAHILFSLKDEIGYIISVTHINHRLRGSDSEKDEGFVERFCDGNEIPFYSRRWEGPVRGENIQDSARGFRYRSFIDLSKEIGAGKIALAHNLEDQAETILLNIIRGAGLDGISGMKIDRVLNDDLHLIRPLLDIGREEIETYAKSKKIVFREDVTNDQTKYNRNFIRHKIFPLIREINPNAALSIGKMAILLQQDEVLLEKITRSYFQKLSFKEDRRLVLDQKEFVRLDISVRARLLKLAYVEMIGSITGIGKDHIIKMDRIATGTTKEGMYDLPGSLRFERRGSELAFCKD